MLAGTNTTSCTSSRGRSEFLAKITAGMAEAGGTETKQSQERGASGFQEAIWGEVGRNGSSSGDLSTILARAQPPGSPYPNTCQETLGGHCRWVRDAQHRTQAKAPRGGGTSSRPGLQAGSSAGGRRTHASRALPDREPGSPAQSRDPLPRHPTPPSTPLFYPHLLSSPIRSAPNLTPSKIPSLAPTATASGSGHWAEAPR